MTKGHFKTFFSSVLAALLLSFLGVFNTAPVMADEHPIYLWVSPATQNLGKLEPGASYEGKFVVQNSGTEDFSYKVYATPYYVTNESYNPTYEVDNNYTQIVNWFTFSKETGHLNPQENEVINFTVKVPSNAPSGGQNATIMVETQDSVEKSAVVKATVRVGSIVYSNVSGNTKECGEIVEKNIPMLFLEPPITASGLVKNCGNVDLDVEYKMSVYPLFSDEEIYTTEENPIVLTTLPETRRYTKITWDNSPSIGFYKVVLEAKYNGNTERIEKIVLICPLWIIILVIVFIGAMVFWLVSRNRERKAKKTMEGQNE